LIKVEHAVRLEIRFLTQSSSSIPDYAATVLRSLRFRSPQREGLARLSEDDWKRALRFSDRAHLTLALGIACRDHLPEWVGLRIDRNLRENAQRWERVKVAYREASAAFEDAGLDFLVLKGFSQCPDFVCDPRQRAQYDLDLYFPPEQVDAAREAALKLGYEPVHALDRRPTDHLPTMIRKTGWQWRENYFDPDLPLSLELHFRFWDPRTEGFAAPGLDQFWDRRVHRRLDELCFAALHRSDAVAYSALHLLRHLLRGDMRPFHAYELARLLHFHADDDPFWGEWAGLHDPSLRKLEAICFALAHRWFDGRLPTAAREEIDRLPAEVTRWLNLHGDSPLDGLFRPNKHELWLHWSLAESRGARFAILRRRLLPATLPGPADAVHVPESELTRRMRLRRRWRQMAFAASRAAYHAQTLMPTLWSGVQWFGGRADFGPQFWRFFAAACLHDFGLFIFFLLYNLYLLRLGFAENVLGYVASAMTAGSLAGCIPAALAMHRFGIRNTLFATFVVVAADYGLRASATTVPLLIVLAFAGGLASSAWAVAISPAIAQLTTERNRAFGFSLMFARGIATGIVAGFVGGRLPQWLERWGLASSPLVSYRHALWAGSAMVLLALWPLARVRLGPALPQDRRLRPPSRPLLRFLAMIAVWQLGTAMFNPLFNAFLARQQFSAAGIGSLVSTSQAAQVGAMLLAPLVFRRFGRRRGIAGMQLATAVALVALAGSQGAAWIGAAYVFYMASQYMSEPGLYSYLMDVVAARDRGGASALNFVVAFGAQAIAAAVAGAFIYRLGYSPVLLLAAVVCAVAALMFGLLREKPAPERPVD
jgi:MFS family permease